MRHLAATALGFLLVAPAAASAQLTQVQREVVLLHDLESWTHAEIAQALDLSEVSSRQHLFNARKALRSVLSADPVEARHG